MPSWLSEFSWLAYRTHADGVYCILCVLFVEDRPGKGVLENGPFTKRHKKAMKLKNHADTKFHQQSMKKAGKFISIYDNPTN